MSRGLTMRRLWWSSGAWVQGPFLAAAVAFDVSGCGHMTDAHLEWLLRPDSAPCASSRMTGEA